MAAQPWAKPAPTLEGEAKKYAGEADGRIADGDLRERILTHNINNQAYRLTQRRTVEEARDGRTPGPATSIFKMYGTELQQDKSELFVEMRGTQGLGWDGDGFDQTRDRGHAHVPLQPRGVHLQRQQRDPAQHHRQARPRPARLTTLRLRLAVVVTAVGLLGCEGANTVSTPDAPAPPVADVRPSTVTHHGIELADPYRWLKDESYPTVDDADVLAYLEAENAYFEAMMAPHQAQVETIFEEIKARQQPDDANVPVKDGAYYYQWRFEEGGQYRIWSRWPTTGESADEGPTLDAQVILDEPALAKDVEYFRLGALSVSNDDALLAYSTDTSGGERFTLRVKRLADGHHFEDTIENTTGTPVWTTDDTAFFYTVVDDQWRPYQVRLHVLGEPADRDRVIYEEADPGFFVGLGRTASKQYVVIETADHVTSEVRLLPADDPGAAPTLVAPRRTEHEYSIDHQGDRFVVKTNDTHKNARLAIAPTTTPPKPPGRRSSKRRTSTTSATSRSSPTSSPSRSASTASIRSA